ncbi:MAG: tetraacyldisaccharide 4'-kinase, partial [Sulfurovum sp.]
MSQHKNSVSFFERLFFKPNVFDWVIISLLSPLALLYATVMFFRRVFTPKKEYSIPIISIGNLTVGGSGKTPFVIALALRYDKVTIISRGYGRQSKGLVEVSCDGHILTDVFASGDEAMLMAKSLKKASVIVSENRQVAIDLALSRGAKIIFLDDGFNRVEIKKFEILLFPKNIKNYLPFPAGPFREFYFCKFFSDLNLYEEIDFKREVTFENETEKMLLVTAISNPKRLKPFLLTKNIVGEYLLEDHAYFDENL